MYDIDHVQYCFTNERFFVQALCRDYTDMINMIILIDWME